MKGENPTKNKCTYCGVICSSSKVFCGMCGRFFETKDKMKGENNIENPKKKKTLNPWIELIEEGNKKTHLIDLRQVERVFLRKHICEVYFKNSEDIYIQSEKDEQAKDSYESLKEALQEFASQ